ncbi:MAG TPA: zinc ribbon domain-containing protein, partial [Verrucomicrobiae bacterium]|nr:zinc ribbon domain-containing protein [Verrucomicrobiae bacterium]
LPNDLSFFPNFCCPCGAASLLFLMPIFEFHCGKCGADSEVLIRSSKWKGTPCPKCGSKRLTKKLSVFASGGGDSSEAAACGGNPSSCGMCGTGRAHSH